MKGFTAHEMRALLNTGMEENLTSGGTCIDDDPAELELHERLEARGLIQAELRVWREACPDDPENFCDEWEAMTYRLTPLGRIAISLRGL